MSSVTFPTAIGGDGSTVTDDDNATTGLRNGGWRTRFIPCFTNLVNIADYVVTYTASTTAFATPPPIGSTTPNTGAFTRVTVTGSTAPANGMYLPGTNILGFATNSSERVRIDASGNVGIGTSSPSSKLHVQSATTSSAITLGASGGASYYGYVYNDQTNIGFASAYGSTGIKVKVALSAPDNALTLDASGNLGLGVTPSGWGSTFKALQGGAGSLWSYSTSGFGFTANAYNNSGWKYVNNGYANSFETDTGKFVWYTAPSGTAGNTISFTQAMTLDASGRLLVAYTSTLDTANISQISDSNSFYGANQYAFTSANAAACCFKVGSQTTGRSVNAKGTINASGADYAEYMTKAGDFEIAKGDVCGIDASGLLTNVFADAVSFVVKSTDPSYVGNDSWGANIDDKDVLEVARQKVDRIAFAGQVPVNVLGAKAGDYIIPIAGGTGIKGKAVASPTFEQYQIAVGKVIAIEPDGRARIIVKVA